MILLLYGSLQIILWLKEIYLMTKYNVSECLFLHLYHHNAFGIFIFFFFLPNITNHKKVQNYY